ncbi:MAG TPA: winged helix-turn-helix domain-containing protein [Acidobacteriota bacterium]|nr:winged helix-turn-helix domain-containing protein [Acidobacteriota bacterium]
MEKHDESGGTSPVRVGAWLVHPDLNSMVHASGETVVIKPKVMDVLMYLCQHAPGVVTKDQLVEEVWRAAVSDDAITHAIYDLRRVFDDNPRHPEYIQTVPKRGYRLIAPVRTRPAATAQGAGRRPWLSGALLHPAMVAAVFVITLFLWGSMLRSPTSVSHQQVKSIGVRPFLTLSGREEDEQTTQGFYDYLIANLSKTVDVQVISGESSASAGCDALLEGSVQRSGGRIRVSLRLVDPISKAVLWADDHSGPADELFLLQDQVVMAASSGLRTRLGTRAVDQERPRAEAQREYLRAKRLMEKETKESLAAAAQHFREAIRLDPEFSGGYLGLAQCYLVRGEGFGGIAAAEALEQAREAALEALNLRPDLAEAHAVLAAVEAAFLRFQTAAGEFQEALALNPGATSVHSEYALFLSAMGRHQAALRHTAEALELDPLSTDVGTARGRALLLAGQAELAIEQLLGTCELEPSASAPYYFLHWAYLIQGDDEKALDSLLRLYQLQGLSASGRSAVREAFARSGFRGVALQELKMIERGTHPNSHSPVQRARLHARAGNSKKAIEWLEQAYRDGYYFGLIWLKVDPVFDDLRSSPRFQRLVQRIGFPQV